MPVVPTAQPTQTLSGERIRNTATATPDAFGARRGRDLANVGAAGGQVSNALAQHAQLFQQRQDEEAVRQAFVDYDTRMRSLLYDPQNGLMLRTGRNAAGVSTEALRTMEEAERQVGETLNERQGRAFRERVMRVREGHLNGLARHEAVEFRKAEEDTLNSMLGSSAESAIAAARSPDVRDEYLAQGEGEINRIAQLHGWDGETRDRKLKEYRTAVHKGIVERLLVNDPSGAREYYESLDKDQVDGTVMATLENSLKDGVTRQRAQEVTDRIVASTRDYREMLDMARRTTDPELRDEVVRRVGARISEEESMRRIEEDRAKEAAWDFVGQAVQGSSYPMPEDIPGFYKLDGYTQQAIISYVDKRRKGIEPTTDHVKKLEFFELPAEQVLNMTPAEFVGAYRDSMADADYNEMENYWIGLRKAAGKPDSLASAGSIGEAAKSAANRYGIMVTASKGAGKYEEQNARRAAFVSQFRAEAERLQLQNGRDLLQSELDQLGARLALKHTIDGQEVSTFELRAGIAPDDLTIGDVEFSDIPEEMHSDIVKALRNKGIAISPNTMLEMYRRWLLNPQ